MIALRKADERGATRLDWLDSCHSFSFADYRDPAHVHFGPLRVINEDVIALGCGFSTHGHRDMEIVNYILSGALAHRDSLGTGSEIRPGEIQRMSAGTGIRHSEYNASQEDAAHLLQIWILPAHSGLEPSYEQKRFDEKAAHNAFLPIVVPRGTQMNTSAVSVDRGVTISVARLNKDKTVALAIAPGHKAWVQLAKGALTVNGENLTAGDGAEVHDETTLRFTASQAGEILVFDLP